METCYTAPGIMDNTVEASTMGPSHLQYPFEVAINTTLISMKIVYANF